MTQEEMKKRQEQYKQNHHVEVWEDWEVREFASQVSEQREKEARKQAIEECAKIAEVHEATPLYSAGNGQQRTSDSAVVTISTKLRSLAHPQPKRRTSHNLTA